MHRRMLKINPSLVIYFILTFGQSLCKICPSQEFSRSKYEALLTFSKAFIPSELRLVSLSGADVAVTEMLPSNWKTTTGAAVSNSNYQKIDSIL